MNRRSFYAGYVGLMWSRENPEEDPTVWGPFMTEDEAERWLVAIQTGKYTGRLWRASVQRLRLTDAEAVEITNRQMQDKLEP